MTGVAAQSAVALLCLGAVLLAILGCARLARSLPALRAAAAGNAAPGALQMCGSLQLDRGRRLHLVDAGGCQALVLTGGATDVLVSLPARL